MKQFYNLPKPIQWIIAMAMMVGGFGSLMFLILKNSYGFFFIILFAPLLNLVTVPFFRLIGYFKYLNPYVISTVQSDQLYDLHNVFTFDYLVNFRWSDRGRPAQRTLLVHYCKALLTIIERIENGTLSPEVKVVGHSYFFNDRTAKRLGFTVSDASLFWKLNSIFQFIELTYLYSFSQGKWSLPKFWKVKKAEITGSDLVMKKSILQDLVEKLLSNP